MGEIEVIRLISFIVDQYINILKDNPIFWMSLDSKELFHSNFLEYLWTLDTNAFIKMINGFLPTSKLLNGNAIDYNVKRELNSFDLCIYHTTKGKRGGNIIIYDLILENKVKSIPYKEQLDEYRIEATNNNPDCRFILLTLSDDFPDRETQTLSSWIVVNYVQLREGIECFKNDYLANN